VEETSRILSKNLVQCKKTLEDTLQKQAACQQRAKYQNAAAQQFTNKSVKKADRKTE
jgi:hypothetical protein